jgi:hypothetical protein
MLQCRYTEQAGQIMTIDPTSNAASIQAVYGQTGYSPNAIEARPLPADDTVKISPAALALNGSGGT